MLLIAGIVTKKNTTKKKKRKQEKANTRFLSMCQERERLYWKRAEAESLATRI